MGSDAQRGGAFWQPPPSPVRGGEERCPTSATVAAHGRSLGKGFLGSPSCPSRRCLGRPNLQMLRSIPEAEPRCWVKGVLRARWVLDGCTVSPHRWRPQLLVLSRGRIGSPAQASPSSRSSRARGGREVPAEVLDEVRLGLRQDAVNDRRGDPALWERKHTHTTPEFGPTAGSKRVGAPSPTGRRARLQAGDAYPLLSHPERPRWHLPSGPC